MDDLKNKDFNIFDNEGSPVTVTAVDTKVTTIVVKKAERPNPISQKVSPPHPVVPEIVAVQPIPGGRTDSEHGILGLMMMAVLLFYRASRRKKPTPVAPVVPEVKEPAFVPRRVEDLPGGIDIVISHNRRSGHEFSVCNPFLDTRTNKQRLPSFSERGTECSSSGGSPNQASQA